MYTCNIPANTSKLNQRWKNVDRQLSPTLFQRWCLVKYESWADVHLWTLFQRWQNNVEATSIELLWFNVDEPLLFQRWYLIEIESCTDLCLSALLQRWQKNVETNWKNFVNSMSMTWCCFQRWYLVENESWTNVCSSALLRRWENSIETTVNCCTDLYWCSLESGSNIKQN